MKKTWIIVIAVVAVLKFDFKCTGVTRFRARLFQSVIICCNISTADFYFHRCFIKRKACIHFIVENNFFHTAIDHDRSLILYRITDLCRVAALVILSALDFFLHGRDFIFFTNRSSISGHIIKAAQCTQTGIHQIITILNICKCYAIFVCRLALRCIDIMSRIFCPCNRSSCKCRSSRRIQRSGADLIFTIQCNIISTRISRCKERCPTSCYFIGNLMRVRRHIVARYIKNLIDAVGFSIDCTLNGDTSRISLRKRRDGHGQHQRKCGQKRQHPFYFFHRIATFLMSPL